MGPSRWTFKNFLTKIQWGKIGHQPADRTLYERPNYCAVVVRSRGLYLLRLPMGSTDPPAAASCSN